MSQTQIRGKIYRYSSKMRSFTIDDPEKGNARWYKFDRFFDEIDKSTFKMADISFTIDGQNTKNITWYEINEPGPRWQPPQNDQQKSGFKPTQTGQAYQPKNTSLDEKRLNFDKGNSERLRKHEMVDSAIEVLKMSQTSGGQMPPEVADLVIRIARKLEDYTRGDLEDEES